MNLKTMCEDTSHKTEEQVCISCYWEWVSAVLTTMKSQETEVVLWGNGMWTLHIHYFGCAESNVSYCNTMEIRGFKEALKKWNDGLYISTDGHPQIIKKWGSVIQKHTMNGQAWESGVHPSWIIPGGAHKIMRVTQRCWKRSRYR